MGCQLFDQRATLGLGETDDMVHAHPENERLASRAMTPDQRMLTPAAATRAFAASFRCTPARLLLRGGIRVRGTIRRLETVHDAQRLAVLTLRFGKVFVRRIRVAELGLSSGRRETPGGEHRRLRRRTVVEQSIDVPGDRRLQVLGPGRILLRVERDLVYGLLGTVRETRPHGDDLAVVFAVR